MTVSIHQFLPAAAIGDGVTGGALFTGKLLRQLGAASNIYAGHYPPTVANQCLPLDAFDAESCDLLLVHHSLGHELESWLAEQTCPKVLFYHNITPACFFTKGSPEYLYSLKGREQLASWSGDFIGAIGASPYNSEELSTLGYSSVITLPLLMELDRFLGDECEPEDLRAGVDRRFILSVGRLVANKRQHLLLEALWHLSKVIGPDRLPQLVLVGGITSPEYAFALRRYTEQLGLQDHVSFTGKLSDSELRWLYARASTYWCASEHEGFCIPLVESGFFRLPVVSFSSSNIPHTLGASGLLLDESDPRMMAAVTAELLDDISLQHVLKHDGVKNLQRYDGAALLPLLKNYLVGLGLNLALEGVSAAEQASV